MAKKEKKKSKKKDNPGAEAVGAVRTAVEKTFHATADSAQSTRTRAQDIVDEVASAAGRLREMIEQVGVLEDLKKQVEALAHRVQALEGGGGASKPAASRAKSSPKSSGTARRKPAASRSTAAKSTSSRAKPAASKSASTSSRSTATRKSSSSTTRKPATRSTPAKKPSSS